MEIEKAIIGSVLNDPSLYHDRVVRKLNPDDFTINPCREAWIRIQRLANSGQRITIDLIMLHANGINREDISTWQSYMVKDIDTLREKVGILTSERRRSRALSALRNCITEIENGARGWEEEVTDTVKALNDSNYDNIGISALEVRMRIRENIEHSRLVNEKVPTGIAAIDNHLDGGLPIPSMMTVFAPAKAGKTTLAATVSYHLEDLSIPHCVITLERSEDHIERMKIARENNIDTQELNKRLPNSNFEFGMVSLPEHSYCTYMHSPSLTIKEIKNEIQYQKRHRNIKAVVIDYMQLIRGMEQYEKKADFQARVFQTLAEITIDAQIAIVLLAQLGEGVQQSEVLAAEQASNLVLIMNRDTGCNDVWFENRASNISRETSIGGVTSPAAVLNMDIGPHFTTPDNFDITLTK